ncbi:hypothetical protein DLAC_00310 [Tieghemostelium lacteum]|uniref:Intimal thickness related receptor IRP domain-containing protein n=1 Tax=Tieghemostelium lacteum TaxID=361077 RepID=A0A152A9D7_TIELA|nr:hypothetical protein DLAC_00310 [Tieghemostelium lacteum]|eukprot:KYR02842.1 hypothetical protein DLAC_00310 [Tieghemostelium lacteum]
MTIFITLIRVNQSMIYDRSFTIKGKYQLVEQFGFEQDGTIEIEIEGIEFEGPEPTTPPIKVNPTSQIPTSTAPPQLTISPLEDRGADMMMGPNGEDQTGDDSNGKISSPITYFNMTIWACKDREYQSLIGSSPSNFIENKLCGDYNAGNCPMQNITMVAGNTINFSIVDSDMYRIIILKCVDTRQVDVKLHYVLKNPGGHLSKGYLPLPKLYKYMSAIIVLVLFATISYWLRYRYYLNQIHYLLLFIVTLKFILIILTMYYWDGADTVGKFNTVLKYFQNLFFSFAETSFFASLFVLSRGWKITRPTLSVAESRTISLILLFLLSVLLFFSFYNDVYYFLSLMILYFFMMPKIFTNITKNIRVLESHLILSRYMNSNSQANYQLKKRVFKFLRSAIVLYLGAILFVNSIRIVMVWWLYYISYCVSEPMSVVMLLFLLFTFRPEISSPNIYLDSNLSDQMVIHDLSRSLEHLMNDNLDPISLASILESKTFDPKSCIIIQYPSHHSPLVLGFQDHSTQTPTTPIKKDE